jgi:hypothetical protein
MKVYRYLCEQEYKNILEKNLDEVGSVCASKNPSNSFRYKRDERYLHFYKSKESMKEMQKLYKLDGKDYYFCEFDIPFRILAHGIGTGYYSARGYDVDYEGHREYIVTMKKFNPDWLKGAELDKEKHALVEKEKGFEQERE